MIAEHQPEVHARAQCVEGGGLRRGYTTGACAAAAARAAAEALVTGHAVESVTIDLPAAKGVSFHIQRCELGPGKATCGTIKDAGDDPDVTHGAEIRATVEWTDRPGIVLAGGEGVGTVTRPGLAVRVGQAAINPTPRRMIVQAVRAMLGSSMGLRGVRVTISVPGGEELTKKTLNPKLGIVGGISILGTTGIVVPYSRAAYRATIYVELRVAAASGEPWVAFSTGNRSEEYARAGHPDWPEVCFIQVGDHMDYALRQARRRGFARVLIAGMVGKVSKLAQGRMQTHVDEAGVDFGFLSELAGELGADESLRQGIGSANTARHVQLILRRAGIRGLEARLAQLAAVRAAEFVNGAFDVDVEVYDIKGELLGTGQAARES
jgi:cobalt-precorrin-5B (C1)-methyltransferase